MHIKNNFIKKIEVLFLLSPLAVLLMAIFNFSDTKSILSRLIPIVAVYCFFQYRDAIKENWHSALKGIFVFGFVLFVIFTIFHFQRGDEFSLPRTLIASLIYLLFVPWDKIPKNLINYLIAVSAIICGFNAFYEFYILNIPRVGIATNPIPYALYVSFLVLSCFYLLLSNYSKPLKIIALIGGLLSLSAIIMTDVRGVILFVPIAIFYLVITTLKSTWKYYVVFIFSALVMSSIFYAIFKQNIDTRIKQTQYEFTMIEKGNNSTSIGIRLDLWLYGKDLIIEKPLFGLGDIGLQESISTMSNRRAAMQPHLHNQYLDFLARYGIIGSLAMALFCLALVMNFTAGKFEYIGNSLVNSMLLMLVFAGLTDVPLHHTHIIYLLTILCGVLIRYSSVKENYH
ncbi:MAG: O-antigen ligase family protein [Vibrio sp.]|uniref:O-antigen ligase family protein n=1 Tax=Vibrio sp. TaxID=678 RepID=UPI003F2B3A9A